ncbi:polyprenyl synthetase family protein [Auraticoccus monumenti]|uniref:Geranylgeranyl diphosphate synthase, type I n=1 Tax=Auraticoccus monumenti TaxID=675864 RepID=A0A1G6VK31_9ACTN|nr:polyprenyl synthetase family protein [Auraticoccus monumenti]SDD53970.1 geranylgeranyl diphosphate synthase, type I [Auraticoccus monumenti]
MAETSTPAIDGRASASASAPTWSETRDALDRRLEQVLADVEETWFRLAPGVAPGVIDDDLPMLLRRLVQSGGKRIRPAMVHWGWLAATAAPGRRADQHATVVEAAAALELLHVFALVHDDVMDESASRRGRPTTHVGVAALHRRAGGRGSDQRFGESIAILVGDLAHAEADHLAAGLPPEVRSTYRTTLLELVQGQRLDLTGAAAGRRDLAHARSVAEAKSGAYTVQRPLQMGVQVAGGGLEIQHALLRYGRHAGAAFALRDDLLGLWGDPGLTGKPVGDDLVAGKPTVVLALAAERLSGHWRRVVDGRSVVPLDPHEVAGVLDAMVEAGVRDEVEDMIANEVRVADEALDDGQVAPEAAEGLRAMARSLAWREA